MNPSHEQNRIEALLALEQLEEQSGQKGFGYHLSRFQELLRSLKLSEADLAEIQGRLDAVQGSHRSGQNEKSQSVRQDVEARIAEARELFAPSDASFQDQQLRFQKAYESLEALHQLLEAERQSLTREDRDACWDALKAARQELRGLRGEAAGQIETQAEGLFQQAKQAIENLRFREAKDSFQAFQREVNQLPLRRDQRQQWRDKFNQLWEQLQSQGKVQREAAQQRSADGQKRLEEALQRVETFIVRKQEDIKAAEDRMNGAHWSEVDPIEKQLARDKDALADAHRRQSELRAKIEDANNRRRPRGENRGGNRANNQAAAGPEGASEQPQAVEAQAETNQAGATQADAPAAGDASESSASAEAGESAAPEPASAESAESPAPEPASAESADTQAVSEENPAESPTV